MGHHERKDGADDLDEIINSELWVFLVVGCLFVVVCCCLLLYACLLVCLFVVVL